MLGHEQNPCVCVANRPAVASVSSGRESQRACAQRRETPKQHTPRGGATPPQRSPDSSPAPRTSTTTTSRRRTAAASFVRSFGSRPATPPIDRPRTCCMPRVRVTLHVRAREAEELGWDLAWVDNWRWARRHLPRVPSSSLIFFILFIKPLEVELRVCLQVSPLINRADSTQVLPGARPPNQ